MNGFDRDRDYDLIPARRPAPEQQVSKGSQCGECGMKFEYGKAYGYCCQNPRCPTMWGRR